MRNNPKCQKCFGTGRVFMAGGSTQQCDCFITNPAPMEERCYNCGSDKHLALQCPYIKTDPTRKEEDMEFENRCRKCDRGFMANVNNARFCPECAKARTADRRAVARDAYMAALGGLCAGGEFGVVPTTGFAADVALETVRRWDAFMAAVDAEGGE